MGNFEYVYVNGCGDTIVSSATIVIMDPNPITLLTDPVGCLDEDEGITLTVEALTGFSPFVYQWDTDPGDTDPSFYYDTGGVPGTATVVVTDICESTTEAEISWEILNELIGEDETICLGQASTIPAEGGTLNFDGTTGFSDILTEVYDEDGNATWTSIVGSDTLITVVDDEDEITGLLSGLYLTGSGGIGDIYLQLVDGCGSVTFSTITVEICQLEFFNVFTPNGDGQNERFDILGLQGYPNSSIEVFDRWGSLVFSDSNYLGGWSRYKQQQCTSKRWTILLHFNSTIQSR